MADAKVSALSAVTTVAATDEIPCNQGGTSKKVTVALLSPIGGGSVKYTSAGGALGATIADYFTSTLSLDAASIYEIECHAYFLKSTAGTVLFQWTFSNAPTVVTSRYQSTPVTGFTTSVITGAEVFAEATIEAGANVIHAASASLTTAVRHSFIFRVRLLTNLATTVQLRCTESAGTVTPQAGSYMRPIKIL